MLDAHFVILGAVLNFYGTASYVIATLRGKTRPNRVSWFLWALAPLIAFSAELGQGVGLRSLMTFMVGFGPLLVLIASFVNGSSYWKITPLDYFCGGLSIVALALWAVTRTGDIPIVFSILSDALAAVPTLRKAYKEPHTEQVLVFILGSMSATITLLTIKTWMFANYAFPAYILIICVTIVLVVKVFHRSQSSVETVTMPVS